MRHVRDGAGERVAVLLDVAHEGRVVGQDLRGRLHVAHVVEVELVDAKAAQVSEHLKRNAERPRLVLSAEHWGELVDCVSDFHSVSLVNIELC